MVYADGKIFVGLGGSAIGDLDDWWEYDISADTWTERTGFPGTERHHPYYFGIDGQVYVGFGHHSADIYNDFYRYDPSTNAWTTLGTFPGQGRVAGTQFSFDGKGYILSGQGETHTNLPTGEFWEYTPTTDSWSSMSAHPGGGRWAPGSFFIDGGIYFTCGEANSGVRKDLIRFQIEGVASTTKNQTTVFSLAPNPTNGLTTITNLNAENTQVLIFDATGRIVEGVLLNGNTLDFSAMDKGVYLVQLGTGENAQVQRVMVQ